MSRRLSLAALLLTGLAACDPGGGGESPVARNVSAIGDTSWKLLSVNGEAVEGRPVVMKASGGFINAEGPCNVINANYIGEAPEFGVETLIKTKTVCDRLGLEDRFIDGLMNGRRAVVEGRRLTITGEGAPTLVFEPAA